jgi:hypothetical protein
LWYAEIPLACGNPQSANSNGRLSPRLSTCPHLYTSLYTPPYFNSKRLVLSSRKSKPIIPQKPLLGVMFLGVQGERGAKIISRYWGLVACLHTLQVNLSYELTQASMTQKQLLWIEVGKSACVQVHFKPHKHHLLTT